jgi:succinate dehydrogenase / fumarate reductase iron-sulfur subunit
MMIKVLRTDLNSNLSKYDTFEVDVHPGMTVLEALFFIKDNLDDSLAFRYSCRGAVCGTCAMLINNVPQLACRTQVEKLIKGMDLPELASYPAIEKKEEWDPETEILVEPLPHLPIIKDLIVDMNRFFEVYREMEPVFNPTDEKPEEERAMEPYKVSELENYTNCVLCAACYGACPVVAGDNEFKGPAALAKLYRFSIDTREGREQYRLKLMDKPSGWQDCEFYTNCKKVCPKGVPPNIAIGKAREKLKSLKVDTDK